MRSKKKRSRKTPSKAYLPKATFEGAGIYLPAFMMGAVTSLLILLLTLSSLLTPPLLDIADKGDEIGFASKIPRDEFDQVILAKGNLGQLNNSLLDLNQSSQSDRTDKRPADEQFETNRRRVDVANQMLGMSLTEKERKLAIISKLDALGNCFVLGQVYNLDDEPNVGANLVATAAEHSKEKNLEIVRTAKMAMLKHDAYTSMKHSDPEKLKSVASDIVALFGKYPNDKEMKSTIWDVVGDFRNYGTGSANRGLKRFRRLKTPTP